MLIKYYNLDKDLILLEDVTDVMVLHYFGDEEDREDYEELFFDNPEKFTHDPDAKQSENAKPLPTAKVIEFAKDGPKRLFVFGRAYVCNNDGKTLEPVISTIDIV